MTLHTIASRRMPMRYTTPLSKYRSQIRWTAASMDRIFSHIPRASYYQILRDGALYYRAWSLCDSQIIRGTAKSSYGKLPITLMQTKSGNGGGY